MRTAAPGRRGPRDRPRIVVGLVLTEPLEHAPRAGDPRATLAGVVRETAPGRDVVPPHLPQVRIDVRLPGGAGDRLPLDEIERARRAKVDVAERERAAIPRPRDVLERLLPAGGDRLEQVGLVRLD